MNLYLNCALITLIGLALSMFGILNNLTNKAKLANLIFDWKLYFRTDLGRQAIGTILAFGLFILMLKPFLDQYPQFKTNRLPILIFFSMVGYFGSDIASRYFSAVNKRLNAAIDSKTTQADIANGTVDSPTPAAKPQA